MGFFSKFFGKQAKPPKLSKTKMTEAFVTLLTERIPSTNIIIKDADNPEEISVHIERLEGEPIIFYPDNLYHAYLQDHENFINYRENIIQNISSVLNSAEDAEITLLPAIKPICWLQQVNKMTQDSNTPVDNSLVFKPLAGELVIVFALDMGTQMSYLTVSELENYSANKDIAEVYEQAMTNFKLLCQQIEMLPTDLGYVAKLDDNYEASLVLLAEQLIPNLSLQGEAVMAVIARNQFIIADSNESEQIANLKKYAHVQMNEAPYTISDQLFCLKDGKIALHHIT